MYIMNVFYINLDSRTDRKQLVENELNELEWKYERFPAIEKEDGRLGCSMSHLRVLMMAKERNLDHVVILEDDIHFKNPVFFNEHLKKAITHDFDVLLIAGNIRPPITPTDNPNLFRVQKSYTTTGYIVKKHYYDKLIQNYKMGILQLMKNPEQMGRYEIDVFWDTLQQKDNWFIIMPRTVTQLSDYSDILKKDVNYDHLMLD